MKAIYAKPEQGSKAHASACGKPRERLAWIWAAGLSLVLFGILSACGSVNTDNIPLSSTCTPSDSFKTEVPETPTLPPATASLTISPSPSPIPEVSASPEPSPTAYEYKGLAILSFTKIVDPDGYATLTARGKPGVEYDISVIYYSGPSKASGLVPKTAGGDGKVSWTWHVGPKTREGEWKIIVSGGGEEVSTHFIVMK